MKGFLELTIIVIGLNSSFPKDTTEDTTRGKERHSFTTTVAPALPQYGYTCHDLRFLAESYFGEDNRSLVVDEDWEGRTLCPGSLRPLRREDIVGDGW